MSNPTRVWMIRHGETAWNAGKRWQGRAPVPLSETGHTQAATLARYLAAKGPQFDVLYSSPLTRALQTAQAITAALDLPVQLEPRLMEVDLGDWQGLTRTEVERWDSERFAVYDAARPAGAPPNGESWLDVRARARASFDDLIARHAGQCIALVSHGGTISQLLESLFGPIERPSLSNTSLTLVERPAPAANWSLVHVAWTPHLDQNGSLGETW